MRSARIEQQEKQKHKYIQNGWLTDTECVMHETQKNDGWQNIEFRCWNIIERPQKLMPK